MVINHLLTGMILQVLGGLYDICWVLPFNTGKSVEIVKVFKKKSLDEGE